MSTLTVCEGAAAVAVADPKNEKIWISLFTAFRRGLLINKKRGSETIYDIEVAFRFSLYV